MKQLLGIALILLCTITNVKAQDWETNFTTAKELAKTQNKQIILVFQGGDWCIPCMKLDKEVWSTEIFKTTAQKEYILLLANFPRKKKNALSKQQQKANAQLFEKYNQQGIFPLVVIMNSDGKVLGKTGYKKLTATEYLKHLNTFKS